MSQNWVPLDDGIQFTGNRYIYLDEERNELYVHGNFFVSGKGDTLRGIAKWNGFSFEPLGKGVFYNPICYSMARYKGILYSCGPWAFNPPNFAFLATYDDTNEIWDTIYGASSSIERLNIVEGNLIMSGWSDSCFGIPTTGICSFDGQNWTSLLTLEDEGGGFHNIYTVEKFKNQLYVGGNFYLPDAYGVMQHDMALLENNQLFKIGNGFQNGGAGSIQKMIVYKDELYICGGFHLANGDEGEYIVRWDGQTLKDVGGGTDAFIMDMKVHNGFLFVFGYFEYAGGLYSPKVAYWDGSQWNKLTGGEDLGPAGIGVERAVFFNDELYVVGNFTVVYGDTINDVARYNHQLPGGENQLEVWINSLNEEIIIQNENQMPYDINLNVYTVNGQCVITQSIFNLQGYTHQQIPIPNLASGVYIVEVTAGFNKVQRKLLKL